MTRIDPRDFHDAAVELDQALERIADKYEALELEVHALVDRVKDTPELAPFADHTMFVSRILAAARSATTAVVDVHALHNQVPCVSLLDV